MQGANPCPRFLIVSTEKGCYMDDAELFELVGENYHKANQDYIQKQISIAAEYLTEEQKSALRREGYTV